MPFIGKTPETGAFKLIDSITTSATDTYALTVNSAAYYPESARNLIVSLNGVTQAPESAYTVSGSNIVFASALTASDVIDYILVIGDAVDIGTPSDNTVGTDQLASTIDLSGKTLTFANDQISGNAIDGGTISNFASTGIDDNATSTAITIDSSQNVGIGTASPTQKLELSNDSSAVYILQSRGTTNPVQQIMGPNGTSAASTGQIGTTSNHGFRFVTNNTERMRIDSSGNLCVGTTSAGVAGVSVATGKNIGFKQANGESLANMFRQSSSGAFVLAEGYQYSSSPNGFASSYSSSLSRTAIWLGDSVRFYADPASTVSVGTDITPTERMRIDNSGNLLVGATSNPATGSAGIQIFNNGGTRGRINAGKTFSGTTNSLANYHNGTYVGGVDYSNTATSFPTSSDQRLKENIVDAPAGNIDAIHIRSFDWKADGSHQTYGVIAQELVNVSPEAVIYNQEEDHWGVDYSKLVPMMIKEIQDLKAEVALLKGAN